MGLLDNFKTHAILQECTISLLIAGAYSCYGEIAPPLHWYVPVSQLTQYLQEK